MSSILQFELHEKYELCMKILMHYSKGPNYPLGEVDGFTKSEISTARHSLVSVGALHKDVENSTSTKGVVYVITDLGKSALREYKKQLKEMGD